MTKAVKILNKYQIKDMLLTGNIQYENFYKEELIQICKVANEMIEKTLMQNQKQKEVFNKIRKFIEENKRHEYRNGRINEYYLELNEKKLNELLNLLKEVE